MRVGSLRGKLVSAVAIGVLFGLAAYGGLTIGALNDYRVQVTDKLQPTGAADPRIVVVAIDGPSLAEVGVRWPWPRKLHAQILRNISGAKAVVYDVLFSAPSSDDRALGRAVADAHDVVLSSEAKLQAEGPGLLRASEILAPVRTVAAAATTAHSNVAPDPDSVVRSLPLLAQTAGGDFLPAMSLAAYADVEGLTGPYTVGPKGVIVGDRLIPTGRRSLMTIAYAPELRVPEGRDDAARQRVISAVDVLKGRVPRSRFDGKIVLVGVTDPALGDNRPTPVAKEVQMPGVLVHANALNTMLTGQYLQPAGNGAIATTAALLALLIALITLFAPVSAAPFAALVLLAAYVVLAILRFDRGSVLDLIYPSLAIIVGFVAALGLRYFTELRGRRLVSNLFSQYVPKAVAEELLVSGRVEDAVRGQRLRVTAVFCDLRAFTAMSTQMEPTQLRDLLNIYYDEASRIVHEHGGTLLTYIGDEIFAVWGAPLPDADGAAKAVACARALQDGSEQLNRRLTAAGLPTVAYGIGVHTGEAIAAHVGTALHRQYTILGDTVNCASRLCTIAGRNEIVVSEETYRSLDGNDRPPSTTLPGIRLKGVGRDLVPARLWPDELRDPTGEQRLGKVE